MFKNMNKNTYFIKKIFILFFIIFIGPFNKLPNTDFCLYADDKYNNDGSGTVINGDIKISSEKFNSLEVNGSLNFKNLSIDSDLKVNGNLSGRRLNCSRLIINGSTDITSLKVDSIESNGYFRGKNIKISSSNARFIGKANISDSKLNDIFVMGGVEVYNSQLQNLELNCTEVEIYNSEVFGNIIMKKVEDKSDFEIFGIKIIDSNVMQVLKLKEGAVVNGDIVFEGDRGELHLYDNSQVKGAVSNAKIINKSL